MDTMTMLAIFGSGYSTGVLSYMLYYKQGTRRMRWSMAGSVALWVVIGLTHLLS